MSSKDKPHLKLVPRSNVIPFEPPKTESPFASLKDNLKQLNRLQEKLKLIGNDLEELKKEE